MNKPPHRLQPAFTYPKVHSFDVDPWVRAMLEAREKFFFTLIKSLGVPELELQRAAKDIKAARELQIEYGIQELFYPDGKRSMVSTRFGREIFFKEEFIAGQYVISTDNSLEVDP